MIQQRCALCGTDDFTILYPANFKVHDIDAKIFSARRLPDRIHYQIVKCNKDGLIYSTPILEYKKIEKLYRKSFTTYDEHIKNLNETYGYYLKELNRFKSKKSRLLEIGCGNGFFLKEALFQGYKEVFGVEPGSKSVSMAPPEIRKNIVIDLFKHGLFKDNFFDVICCFQTFDHIPNPNEFLSECYKILKKGGHVLFINHDVESLSARILRESSPIIDIEHTYLYSKKTMREIFSKNKFRVLTIENAFSMHDLSHWIWLFPLPAGIKKVVLRLLKITGIGKAKIKIYPGNLVLIARA
ncbi:hypothetical protein A3H80_04025 [Candidatus Roizmanbacteria bacterium RIFCSPLOWO2_02_FULL_37_19]|uniref:Methyltransferase type 11 domain-containing protein n=1 Tax=Candidatus Roizmanbacteria bacterium RIFCSPHIGHO2_02_FULL_37_24 TaxID=1802037 RepID=A0A1F7GW29_9BACT|nr:MAG: hypothetical protein A3C24_00835 [Candidatus Roizmanbacteria bacterium RIFCSPHIGHO2_02_FULL_37_24]OGK53676.1 MAG: hypothetical protein A3H80_04025 [Candidatus Roizmanbacteria bacterium RIFCSPLOWO2_02_FULL_37_19]